MTTRMQVPEAHCTSKVFSSRSEDRGKTWTFIDGAGLVREPGNEREKLAQVLPDFPPQLSLPTPEQPVLEPK